MNAKKKSIGFAYAWSGLVEILKTERNFKIHISVSLLVMVVNTVLKLSTVEWAIIFLAIGSVLITEVFNTAVERVIDYIKPDIHPLAKHIKDMAAGGVLVASIISVIIGILIYLPKIIALL